MDGLLMIVSKFLPSIPLCHCQQESFSWLCPNSVCNQGASYVQAPIGSLGQDNSELDRNALQQQVL